MSRNSPLLVFRYISFLTFFPLICAFFFSFSFNSFSQQAIIENYWVPGAIYSMLDIRDIAVHKIADTLVGDRYNK